MVCDENREGAVEHAHRRGTQTTTYGELTGPKPEVQAPYSHIYRTYIPILSGDRGFVPLLIPSKLQYASITQPEASSSREGLSTCAW
jgi:hypothetical protein